eukprot:gnl/TRDRNA2_/TRDRNA2_63153_c1_seq1.p1 gnl/TRDRNA2_/TRDRNA2_63153_c1~~gnl/TRDRNA2_/TRDRNA2_63153_c1_seq1.p1  ORF type:complete len:951 (-),score=212.71 gnl/TRDRNA2_/TRDRNA2_63153_c1_seq1:56-2569(-)
MTDEGSLVLSSGGSLAMQRIFSYYVPTSYSPMLAKFNHILFNDASWGFVGAGQDTLEEEIHVARTLNVVGSGAQHRTVFKDMMRHIGVMFSNTDFKNQPDFVVDTGCGDGQLLMQIYETIKNTTPRGKVFDKYPLTMVGVDINEAARETTSVNLKENEIPHKVIHGDVGDPLKILEDLKKKEVDPKKTLHVRSFLDHERSYVAPDVPIDPSSALGRFAIEQVADFVHLDKHGETMGACELFQTLVDHFNRWADALTDSFGLCVLEVMMLDVPTTKRYINENVSFYFDIVQCLSRQYMISPLAFTMGAALAGLLPQEFKKVKSYPEQASYCRMLSQHMVRRDYQFRFAEPNDLPQLVKLEEMAWQQEMRASPEVLERRLRISPTTNFVCVLNGKVVAVLYMQRILQVSEVHNQKFMQISDSHDPNGRILQLIALASDTEDANVSLLNLGSELRAFALHMARLDPTVDTVVGVTRCKNLCLYSGTMEKYVRQYAQGNLKDPLLDFHTSYGAEVKGTVANFRPEDAENGGMGVLVQYSLEDPALTVEKKARSAETQGCPTIDFLSLVIEDLGYEVDKKELPNADFFSFGMDSLELVRIKNRLSTEYDMNLPVTLLIDFPTVSELCKELDTLRGVEGYQHQAQKLGGQEGREAELQKRVAQLEKALHQQQGAGPVISRRPPAQRNKAGTTAEAKDQQIEDSYKSQDISDVEQMAVFHPMTEDDWDSISPDEVLRMMMECKKLFLSRKYQERFASVAKRCYPDIKKYIYGIEPLLVEAQGPLLVARGWCQDEEWEHVQEARGQLDEIVMKYWSEYPDVERLGLELIHITGQDQIWSEESVAG